MPKRPSEYYRPKTLAEALRILSKPDTQPLAGGTSLLAGGTSSAVVDLQDLGLDRITLTSGRLIIGAVTSLAELEEYLEEVVDSGDMVSLEGPRNLLVKAIHSAGPNTYRNAATIGGVIAARLPDSELLAALLVTDTELTLEGTESRTVTVIDYLAADSPLDGLITEITLPWESGTERTQRVARTPADYPIVSVTLFKPDGGLVRLAATGIDLRPIRLESAERALESGEGISAVEKIVKLRVRHPGDFRGDAEYRAEMAVVLTRRVLTGL